MFMGRHVPSGREALAMHLWWVEFPSGPPNYALVAQLAAGNRLKICTVWVRIPLSAPF